MAVKFTFDRENLKKHRISHRDCLEVYADPFNEDAPNGLSERGNKRFLIVGRSPNRKFPIEIGIEIFSDEHHHIYHAMKARDATMRLVGYEE